LYEDLVQDENGVMMELEGLPFETRLLLTTRRRWARELGMLPEESIPSDAPRK
jgi:hypothetical protein